VYIERKKMFGKNIFCCVDLQIPLMHLNTWFDVLFHKNKKSTKSSIKLLCIWAKFKLIMSPLYYSIVANKINYTTHHTFTFEIVKTS